MFIIFFNQYFPNYNKLYPDTEISDDVLKVLQQSDRKIKRMEYDLKRERWEIDMERQIARCHASRENSLDHMLEDGFDFSDDRVSIENLVTQDALLSNLRQAIPQLSEKDQDLIEKLFYKNMTQEEVAETLGITQPAVIKRRKKALQNLRKIMKV